MDCKNSDDYLMAKRILPSCCGIDFCSPDLVAVGKVILVMGSRKADGEFWFSFSEEYDSSRNQISPNLLTFQKCLKTWFCA